MFFLIIISLRFGVEKLDFFPPVESPPPSDDLTFDLEIPPDQATMGHCCSKQASVSVVNNTDHFAAGDQSSTSHGLPAGSGAGGSHSGKNTPAYSFTASPFQSPLPAGVAPSPARTPGRTPGRKFRWPLPPPSPAKPIMAALLRRQGKAPRPKDGPIPEEQNGEEGERERALDKSFGYAKNFGAKFEVGKEIGRGHFGHTCWAKGKKGELKGQPVAVKIISKAKVLFLFLIFVVIIVADYGSLLHNLSLSL